MRPPRRLAGLALCGATAVAGIGLTGCSGSSGSSATTRPSDGSYVHLSGHGDRKVGPVTLPKTWTVAWHFDCSSTAPGPFRLTVTPHTGTRVTLADQRGLGGGGYKPFTTAGATTFAVTTGCAWNLKVGPPGTDSAVDTTTTKPSTTAPSTSAR